MQDPSEDLRTLNESSPNAVATALKSVFSELEAAAIKRDHPWHLMTVCTSSVRTGPNHSGHEHQGGCGRLVVLRRTVSDPLGLWFHTDARSPKIRQLSEHAGAGLAFYDPSNGIQLIVSGPCTIHTDDEAATDLWNRERESSLRTYLAPFAPGTRRTAPERNLPPEFQDRLPTRKELEPARSNFAAVCCHPDRMDLLLLRRNGNLRLLFEPAGSEWSGTWIAP